MQEEGTEKPFILLANNAEAELSEGIQNHLQYTQYTSRKDWQDEDDHYHSRQNYSIQLQRKEADGGTWEAVDLQGLTIKIGNGDSETITESGSVLDLDKAQLNVLFSDLPKYNSDGKCLNTALSKPVSIMHR